MFVKSANQAENDLLKDKVENLRRCFAYTEDVLSHKIEEVKQQLVMDCFIILNRQE